MLSRRALTWTALAIAVAVIIAINEPPNPQPDKPVAVAPREDDAGQKTGAKPGPAPEMRATGGVVEKVKEQSEAVASASPKRDASKVTGEEELAAGSAAPDAPGKPTTASGKPKRPVIAKFYADGKPIVLPKDEKLVESGKAAPSDADSLVVIVCDVSAEAAEKHVFRQLLAENQIAWAEQPQGAKEEAAEDREVILEKNLERVAENENRRAAGPDLRLTESLAKAGAAELVEVRATRAQIDATLDQLAALPEQFLTVSIEAGANTESRGRWNQYARRSEAAGFDNIAQRGIARRISRLDALDDATLKLRVASPDGDVANLEAKPAADAVSAGEGKAGGSQPGGAVGGRWRNPGQAGHGIPPAEQPASGDLAHRRPALPSPPARSAGDLEPATKPSATAAPAAGNAPKSNLGGDVNGVANGERPMQAGGSGVGSTTGAKEGGGPKTEPAAPATAAPAPPKPAGPPPAAEPQPVEMQFSDSKAGKGEAGQGRFGEGGKDLRDADKPAVVALDKAEKDTADDRSSGLRRRADEVDKKRKLAEKKIPADGKEEPVIEREGDGAAHYAYGPKAVMAQRPAEPTCRVLFVLRVVPSYAAEAKAAAALKAAAPKAEIDAAREMPAAKSK
jgi:hypothetical protein